MSSCYVEKRTSDGLTVFCFFSAASGPGDRAHSNMLGERELSKLVNNEWGKQKRGKWLKRRNVENEMNDITRFCC